jgi:RNA polymerase sigma factor (sigma-70 family)
MHGLTETQNLVRACIGEEPIAQRQLYEQYSEQMMGVCYRYTKSIHDAEDVLQEGFVKVFRKLHLYRFEGELGAWIRKIMVHTALNYLKQNQKYRAGQSFSDVETHPVAEEKPDMHIHSKELAEVIRRLPLGYQTVFNLHAVEGYTHVEIAKLLGINEGTSRSQYLRARNMLMGWLQEETTGFELLKTGIK